MDVSLRQLALLIEPETKDEYVRRMTTVMQQRHLKQDSIARHVLD